MVDVWQSLNFASMCDAFFAATPLKGPNATLLQSITQERAQEVLSHADARYVPTFKVLELLAAMVQHARILDDESQLREIEARALLNQSLSEDAPLVHRFLLDASLERARYEPMMILENAERLREHALEKRWTSMRYAHQRYSKLPPAWMEIVDASVMRAITAPCFANFRVGPLMQLFAEMLETARSLHASQASLETLRGALSDAGTLWKRYALKPKRYSAKPPVMNLMPVHPTLH